MRRICRLRPSFSTNFNMCSPRRETLAGFRMRPSSDRPWRRRSTRAVVTSPSTRTTYSLSSAEAGPISALASTPSSDSSRRPRESMSSRPSAGRLASLRGMAADAPPQSASRVRRRAAGTWPGSGWAETTPGGLWITKLMASPSAAWPASASVSVWPGSILRPTSATGWPSMETRPCAISASASRREQTPLCASQRFTRWGSGSS